MKKNELIKIIRKVVREEVKKEVNGIFIKEGVKNIPKNGWYSDEKVENNIVKKSTTPNTPPTKMTAVRYTKDEALNRVLNETKGGLPQSTGDDYPLMGGDVFDSSKANEIAMKSGQFGDQKEFKRELGAAMTARSSGVKESDVPDGIMKALTRDYSDLMKVINKDK